MSWLPKNCVVVPFDFSEQSDPGLESARVFVASVAGLHVVHVLPTIELAEPGVIWETIDDDARRRHAEAAFRERFAKTPFEKVDFQVRFGDPGREIAAFAEKLHADLIVMPSHGRTGLSRLFIGSVAERVVRLAHCPVLILK
ncbi:MAG TPA: universal stress protein [Planctomycetaceae bacterium]|jgi:nucleotide-binding universal stress UspA family protein|nr:universal stress protein [Planctomycetaceae bacterium]